MRSLFSRGMGKQEKMQFCFCVDVDRNAGVQRLLCFVKDLKKNLTGKHMRRITSKTGKSVLLLLFLEENSCLLYLSVQTPGEAILSLCSKSA